MVPLQLNSRWGFMNPGLILYALKMTIEIVDLLIKKVIFHIYVNISQRVILLLHSGS